MATANTEEDAVAGTNLLERHKKPVCLIVLGMAGSGKTTFVQQLTSRLHARNKPPYVINLDPACREVPYPVNIDIRDTVNYKEVMKQYSLGPNGGIVTSLNLFATKFDQVIKLVEKRSANTDLAIFDTPGQIEVFTWSASGTIITETLAALFPTVVVYVIDIVRSVSPITFMSNMLYACSILYKLKLPFIVVMNKIDVVKHNYALEWMTDFDAFELALSSDSSYNANLSRSLSLTLDEFYKDLTTVGFSAVTGEGFDEFLAAVDAAVVEYETDYCPEHDRLQKLQAEARSQDKARQKDKFESDFQETNKKLGITTGRYVSQSNEILLRSHAVGGESSSDDDEREGRPGDDDDEDDRIGHQSFRNFLEEQKKKQQSKSNSASS
uniref:GPN-loop GTPase n=1 Tax=Daphnia sinensis TaxID=1820382 RepID=A0A4Y7NA05_9CRUS|nr:EOG090X072H [Daphnia sinensis]SVE89292.1 EOG090X072H [Daphnia sinensis]SVE89911.1 EOG090X072H [Daphnia sinensis]SVE90540.1 EOG090X072H [Daphnia sinensis]SVE91168.1 EOG090X072H [Daphnia sinensis]